jgi:ribosomal protein S18 acetylase RimI-like enzyme
MFDITEIKNLLRELRPDGKPVSLKQWRKILKQNDVKIFTAKEGGKIIGMAILRWHDLPIGRVGAVEDVIVAKEHRGQGHGESMMKQIILFSKKRKIAYIDLTSRPERIAANQLYQKIGWKRRETNTYRLTL